MDNVIILQIKDHDTTQNIVILINLEIPRNIHLATKWVIFSTFFAGELTKLKNQA